MTLKSLQNQSQIIKNHTPNNKVQKVKVIEFTEVISEPILTKLIVLYLFMEFDFSAKLSKSDEGIEDLIKKGSNCMNESGASSIYAVQWPPRI